MLATGDMRALCDPQLDDKPFIVTRAAVEALVVVRLRIDFGHSRLTYAAAEDDVR